MSLIRNTLGRPSAAMCLSIAALAAVVGCQDQGGSGKMSGTNGSTNSSSVSAPNTSKMGDDTSVAAADSVQYFPHGAKGDAVLMVEGMGPKSIMLNKEAQYSFKITNMLQKPVHNVVLTSTNPDGFQVTGANGATTQPMDKGMGYTVGDLAAGESKTVTVMGMATKVGEIDTCYGATFTPPALCTMVMVTNPALQLMVDAPADADICKPLTYKYTVKNTGTGVAKGVVLTEPLPDGLMTAADGKNSVMANLGDIPQGGEQSVTADLKAAKPGKYAGSASAKSDRDVATEAVATTTTIHAPVLKIDVAGPATEFVGKDVSYTITVTNTGDATSPNTMLQVQHSAGLGNLVVPSVDAQGMVSLGDLAPNQTVTRTATGSSTAGGAVDVVATASSACAGSVNNKTQTTFNSVPSILLETVDEKDPVKVGDFVIYDLKVTNQSTGPDMNLVVKAMLPDGEVFDSVEGPTQPTADGMNLTFPTVPSLEAKGSVTWKIKVKAAKAGDVQFKTTATCDGVGTSEKSETTKLY